MKTIYVSGASLEIDLVERVMSELRKHGWTIADDWCAAERANAPEPTLTDRECETIAERELTAIENASVFWLLSPEAPSSGSWVELGYVLAVRRYDSAPRIIVSGRRTLFTSLVHERFDTHEEALATLCLGAHVSEANTERPEAE